MALKMRVAEIDEGAQGGKMVIPDLQVQHNPRIAPDSLEQCLKSLERLIQSLPSSASDVSRLSPFP
jgi:hypothetical protein